MRPAGAAASPPSDPSPLAGNRSRSRDWSPWIATGAYVALLVLLCLRSVPRVTGDGAEYLLLAERFAQGQLPGIPVDEARARGVFEPRLIDREGAQQLWHFWFLPLLVAPVVRVSGLVSGPVSSLAFTIVNIGLLGVAFGVVHRRVGAMAAVFIGCSPILWWVDKAQVEAFTLAMMAIGCALVTRPHLAAVAFAMAATQNPPFAAVAIALCVVAMWRFEPDERARGWLWCALALLLCVIHPLFYLWRLGRWTPLVETSDARIPGLRAILTILADLNVGLIVNAPVVFVVLVLSAAAGVMAAAGRRSPGAGERLAFFGGMATLFLFACAQAPNVNSGGTPGMSRYALWFVPLPLLLWPLLTRLRTRTRTLWAVTISSAVWSLLFFQPSAPEHYLSPTSTAAWVWSHHPSWDDPLPEIFAERLRHKDGVNTLAATPDCAKALVLGGQWPAPCEARTLPDACQSPGALCYANRRPDGSYAFVETSRRGGIRLSSIVP